MSLVHESAVGCDCPSCGRKNYIPVEYAGNAFTCENCKTTFEIPEIIKMSLAMTKKTAENLK